MGKRRADTLNRGKPTRHLRPVYWISTEGQTERDYFQMDVFRELDVSIRFPRNVSSTRTNPAFILQNLKKELESIDLSEGDEAWVVVDVDEWDEQEFTKLLKWAHSNDRYHVAISNPKFELFLLLHVDEGIGCTTASKIDETLKRRIPSYDKHIDSSQFDAETIQHAIERAETKRMTQTDEIPGPGTTDVYKLAQHLLRLHRTEVKADGNG